MLTCDVVWERCLCARGVRTGHRAVVGRGGAVLADRWVLSCELGACCVSRCLACARALTGSWLVRCVLGATCLLLPVPLAGTPGLMWVARSYTHKHKHNTSELWRLGVLRLGVKYY
eukprot:3237988-Prymnesium_polylepis.1